MFVRPDFHTEVTWSQDTSEESYPRLWREQSYVRYVGHVMTTDLHLVVKGSFLGFYVMRVQSENCPWARLKFLSLKLPAEAITAIQNFLYPLVISTPKYVETAFKDTESVCKELRYGWKLRGEKCLKC